MNEYLMSNTRSVSTGRSKFLFLTYSHLLLAVVAFVCLEAAYFATGLADTIATSMLSVNWLWSLGGYILVACFAAHYAHQIKDLKVQYLCLFLYILAESLIFVPLLYIADKAAPGVIDSAALTTLLGFGMLSAIVFLIKKDFSFLRSTLIWGGAAAFLLIICACLFGFHLGTWFSVAMIFLAGLCILYDTSNGMLHYTDKQYVPASIELFSSLSLMFWYVIRLGLETDY